MASGERTARRPTLADVAAAAGVSPSTASRALGTGTHVRARTRERVWAAAERLSFEPNQLARSLRRGSTMAVGLVIPDVASAFYGTALKGVQEVLEAAGYHVLVVNTGRAAEPRARGDAQPARAPGRRPDHRDLRRLRGHRRARRVLRRRAARRRRRGDRAGQRRGRGAARRPSGAGARAAADRVRRARRTRSGDGRTPAVFTARERLDGFRASAGRAGLPLPPEYIRFADPLHGATRASRRHRAARARRAADRGRGRDGHARHGRSCRRRAPAACGSPTTSPSSPSTSRRTPTCSSRR